MRNLAPRYQPQHEPLPRLDVDFARPWFGDEERAAVDRVMAGYWLANGKENEAFEREFADYIGVPHALAVNSGSSANLLALAALDLPKGSKVLTSGCGFPATLSPILHLGLIPVLVDYDSETLNANVHEVIDRLPEVKAVILAHTLGNPLDMQAIMEAASKLGVAVIEDCCEAIGAQIAMDQVGSFGDMGTFSFYPSHQITALGGGGMVVFRNREHYSRAQSMRDWGKSVQTYGRSNTTYNGAVDGQPYFPHYIYETVGWNFKLPEANAAFGREQMKRLSFIVAERRSNRELITKCIPARAQQRILPVKTVQYGSPSWFGVPLTVPGMTGRILGDKLEALGVRHRPFFAGNITRHGPFRHLRRPLPVADYLMENTIFVGCYAGMTMEECMHVGESIGEAIRE